MENYFDAKKKLIRRRFGRKTGVVRDKYRRRLGQKSGERIKGEEPASRHFRAKQSGGFDGRKHRSFADKRNFLCAENSARRKTRSLRRWSANRTFIICSRRPAPRSNSVTIWIKSSQGLKTCVGAPGRFERVAARRRFCGRRRLRAFGRRAFEHSENGERFDRRANHHGFRLRRRPR